MTTTELEAISAAVGALVLAIIQWLIRWFSGKNKHP
jgi:hypothetical protein